MFRLIITSLFFVSCGAKLSPAENVGLGVVGTTAVNKVIDKTKEIAKYDINIKLPNVEICHKVNDNIFRCVWTNCEENCSNFVSESEIQKSLDELDALVISLDSWTKFLTYIKLYCTKQECEKDMKQFESFKLLVEK